MNYASEQDAAKMITDLLQASPDIRKRIDETLKRYDEQEKFIGKPRIHGLYQPIV
jgi:hypothetical protein